MSIIAFNAFSWQSLLLFSLCSRQSSHWLSITLHFTSYPATQPFAGRLKIRDDREIKIGERDSPTESEVVRGCRRWFWWWQWWLLFPVFILHWVSEKDNVEDRMTIAFKEASMPSSFTFYFLSHANAFESHAWLFVEGRVKKKKKKRGFVLCIIFFVFRFMSFPCSHLCIAVAGLLLLLFIFPFLCTRINPIIPGCEFTTFSLHSLDKKKDPVEVDAEEGERERKRIKTKSEWVGEKMHFFPPDISVLNVMSVHHVSDKESMCVHE